MPPSTTEPTGPSSAAVAPDSNSPSWFDPPMNTELTALTRPRISSGVSSCTSDWRITTLTMSAAPTTTNATSDSANDVDNPNTNVAAPYNATAPSSTWPARRVIGQRVSATDSANAPAAGAARSRPRPHGPTNSTSFAKIGSSAVAPPSSTANRSSEMAPSTTGLLRTKRTPPSSASSVTARLARGACP